MPKTKMTAKAKNTATRKGTKNAIAGTTKVAATKAKAGKKPTPKEVHSILVMSNIGRARSVDQQKALRALADSAGQFLATHASVRDPYAVMNWTDDEAVITVRDEAERDRAMKAFEESAKYRVEPSNVGGASRIYPTMGSGSYCFTLAVAPRATPC